MNKHKIIICPNEEKLRILEEMNKDNNLTNITFYTKEEFLREYYFSYDEQAIYYCMKKYHWHLDVCRIYLKYLYVIDINKEYQNNKLQFLQELKKELIKEKLITMSHYSFSFQDIEVRGYYLLDKYEEILLGTSIVIPNIEFHHSVYEFMTMEEEVNAVAIEILKLIKKGIPLNKIYLSNVTSDYYYTLKRIFSYYHIPIEIPFMNSIYSSKVVSHFLETGDIEVNEDNSLIIEKITSILSKYIGFNREEKEVKDMIIDDLKHTYFPYPKYSSCIHIKDLFQESFLDDEYVFVLGFNQDILPVLVKDIEYIDDSSKSEVDMYTTSEWNMRNKKITTYLLANIKNLFLSYKKESPFTSFFPSSLISDLGLEVITEYKDDYHSSNFYNKLRLADAYDQFSLYGEKTSIFDLLKGHINIPYKTYSHIFKGIDKELYLKNIAYPLTLSYTALNCYNECRFHYYLQYVLKLNIFEDTFPSFIGSMYHKILSLCFNPNFSLEEEYEKYLQRRELSLKERLLLVRIKIDLEEFIEVLKKQNYLIGYDGVLTEEKVEIPIDSDISVTFVGYIDKILYYKKIEDTYFSIIDYKTGSIDTNIEPMKYGLHMQLPVYLYLIHYGKVFDNPIFTGIYYQNILFSYPTWSLKLESEKKKRYYLDGYSTDKIELLERFDSTYQESELIKSMKYSEDKGFGTYSKVMDDDTLYQLVQYTKNHIKEKVGEIIDGNFTIDPKVYNMKNVSCQFCKFHDICFMKDSDLVYLDKVDNLSFLGGDS